MTTKLVRVNLSALARQEWSAIVEVPADFDQHQLKEVADRFYDRVDATEFSDDWDFWEKGEGCYCDQDHVQETDHPQYTVDADYEIEEVPLKQFAVYVHDKRLVKYVVDAQSVEHAQNLVERSEDADKEFGGSTKDGEWYVDNVEEC